jgi:hypothetical protein
MIGEAMTRKLQQEIEEITKVKLPSLPDDKREAKSGSTANGFMFYGFASLVLLFGIFVGVVGALRGGSIVLVGASVVFVSIAFVMAGIAGHNVSGEMSEAIEDSGKPLLGLLTKLITAKLGK